MLLFGLFWSAIVSTSIYISLQRRSSSKPKKEAPESSLKPHPIDLTSTLPRLQEEYVKTGIEYWYFDFEDPKSCSKVLVIFKRCDGAGPKGGGVHLEITTPEGREEKYYLSIESGSFQGYARNERCFIEINRKNRFCIHSSGHFRMKIDIGAVKVKAKGKSQCPGFLLNKDGYYFFGKQDGKAKSGASITMPYFTGEVSVTMPRKKISYSFSCNGYHDHPFATDHFLKSHHRWNWMRFCHDEIYVMYARVKPSSSFQGICKYLYVWKKGMKEPLIDVDYDIQEKSFQGDVLLISYPSSITLESKTLKLKIDMNQKRTHSNQIIFNHSIFGVNVIFDEREYKGEALVEYFEMPPYLTWLARWLICYKYRQWENNAKQ